MHARFVPNTPDLLTIADPPDPHSNLLHTLELLLEQYPPTARTSDFSSGLYHGPLSIAYLFLSLSRLYPSLTLRSKTLLEISTQYLQSNAATSHPTPGIIWGKWGVADESMVNLALRACLTQEVRLTERFCAAAASAAALEVQDETNEWLYGRAGYLYLLRLISSSFPPSSPVQVLLRETTDKLVTRILASPRPWNWHRKVYTGAVHGIASIITQIVLSSPDHAQHVQVEVEQLLSLQRDNGNWPSSFPDSESDKHVQFCHGAPGIVISLLALRPYFPKLKTRIDRAIEKGRICVWERGLLTKEPGLCHGIAGNAIALGRKEAVLFMGLATEEKVRRGVELEWWSETDDLYGLFTGMAGRAWAWAVLERWEEVGGKMVGYTDV